VRARFLVGLIPVQIDARGADADAPEDRLGARHLLGRAVCGHQKAVGLDRRFVCNYAVLGDAAAIQGRAECAQPADDDGAFDRGDHRGGEVSQYDHVSYDRNEHEDAAEEPTPESTPEGAALTPEFHAVSGVVEPNDVFIGVVALAHHAEVFDVDAGGGQLLHRGLGSLMIGKDGYQGVVVVLGGSFFLK
jgi:hypothetical protein